MTGYEIEAPWLDSPEPFGLDSPSAAGAGTVGDRIATTVAEEIHDRSIEFRGPDGAWRMNAESTARGKGFNAPNYVTGLMTSEEKLRGQVAVAHDQVEQEYGDGQTAAAYRGQTDRQVAARTDSGQSHQLIKRPMYWLDDPICDKVLEMVADEWEAQK